MKSMKNEAVQQTTDLATTSLRDARAFALPDLSKPAQGVRVRSGLRAGVLRTGGDPETM